MDKIILKNMSFFAYHGVMEEEKVLGQRFFIDAVLFSDLRKAGQTDDVNFTLHYGMVYDKIKDIAQNKRFDLIEGLAHHICINLLEEFKELSEIQLTVRKPSAPVNGVFDYMAIEITRDRGDLL